MYKKIIVFSSFLSLFFVVPILYADNGPEVYTRLLIDRDDDINGRIPLILVHGNHGGENQNYWWEFKFYFYFISDLHEKFKLYNFIYDSDVISVDEIAEGFRFWIDEKTEYGILPDTPFMILAHSMGGLVSRSFMQKQLTQGNWGSAGNRVIRLITLGTPHHGTPGANGPSKDLKCGSYNPKWFQVLRYTNLAYWCFSDFLADGEGDDEGCLEWWKPNRADLIWDNYDGEFNEIDANQWLLNLNSSDGFTNKVISYYGYISIDDLFRTALIDCVNECITSTCTIGCLAGFAIEAVDEGDKLKIANAVMGEALGYEYNDGMVPIESARFSDANPPVDFYRVFTDFDHGEIKGDRLWSNKTKYDQLFKTLESDITPFFIGISATPHELTVPAEATFSTKDISGYTYEWEINDPDNHETLFGSTVSHVFKKKGHIQ